MNKKAQMAIVGWIVTIIIGVVMTGVVYQIVRPTHETTSVTDETFTGSNSSYVALDEPNWVSNSTCNCSPFNANLVAGSVLMTNDTCDGQTVECSYSYYPTAYQTNSTTRVVLPLVTVLFAVMILVAIAYFAIRGA